MCMVNIGNRISTLENEFQFLELLQFYSLSDVGCSSFSEMDILSQNIIIMMIHSFINHQPVNQILILTYLFVVHIIFGINLYFEKSLALAMLLWELINIV